MKHTIISNIDENYKSHYVVESDLGGEVIYNGTLSDIIVNKAVYTSGDSNYCSSANGDDKRQSGLFQVVSSSLVTSNTLTAFEISECNYEMILTVPKTNVRKRSAFYLLLLSLSIKLHWSFFTFNNQYQQNVT